MCIYLLRHLGFLFLMDIMDRPFITLLFRDDADKNVLEYQADLIPEFNNIN